MAQEGSRANLISLAMRFEQLVAEILKSQGFSVISYPLNHDLGFDFEAQRAKTRLMVEVKLYRSQDISPSLLASAAQKLAFRRMSTHQSVEAMVVTNAVIEQNIKDELTKEWGVILCDYFDLRNLAEEREGLRRSLDDLVREAYTFDVDPLRQRLNRDADSFAQFLDWTLAQKTIPAVEATPEKSGALLCAELQSVKQGNEGFRQFEKSCEKSVKYLFSNDLTAWQTQSATNSGLHIFDLIARVSSSHSFWIALVQDLRTRYVVFEFKNYKEPITQSEIYTTEKYLYPSALRATALIVAREGASDNALEATRGALRESGKLILVVSLKELCSMLHAKDSGDAPTDVLAGLLDEMLVKIDR